jgi:ribosomal protein L11 methyltransferase
MNYKQTKVYTTTMGAEFVSALLLSCGIDQASVEDAADIKAILEGKTSVQWDYADASLAAGDLKEVILTFYTEENDAGNALLQTIKTDLMKLKANEQYGDYGESADFGRLYAETSELDNAWKDSWKEGFRPFRVGERFVIRPPWYEYDGEGTVILMDPGMAFGTGSHETTSMCVETLETTVRPDDLVLDIGTGSGILSIASVLLGARKAVGIEIDPDAAAAAEGNVKMNLLEDKIDIVVGDITESQGRAGFWDFAQNDRGGFDIICANLFSGIIKMILPIMRELLRTGGKLIISGLLDVEEPAMKEAITQAGFHVIEAEVRGEWLCLCAEL